MLYFITFRKRWKDGAGDKVIVHIIPVQASTLTIPKIGGEINETDKQIQGKTNRSYCSSLRSHWILWNTT